MHMFLLQNRCLDLKKEEKIDTIRNHFQKRKGDLTHIRT